MLKKIAKRIAKEVEQAEDYAEQAYAVKMTHRDLSELFLDLAEKEIEHAERLFKMGFKMISDRADNLYTREAGKTQDAAYMERCKDIWQWEYLLMSDRIAKIKYKIARYEK